MEFNNLLTSSKLLATKRKRLTLDFYLVHNTPAQFDKPYELYGRKNSQNLIWS
jgi:hypothetical protein